MKPQPSANLGKHSQRQTPADGDKGPGDGKKQTRVPVLYNRKNLADELNMAKNRIFRAYDAGVLEPDAFMCDGQPLFFACRIGEISMLLNSHKI